MRTKDFAGVSTTQQLSLKALLAYPVTQHPHGLCLWRRGIKHQPIR